MGGCHGVVRTGGGGGPGGFLVVLCRWDARGVGAWVDADSQICGHGLSLRGCVETRGGGGSGACAVCGLTSRVGRGAGTLLVDPGVDLVRSGVVWGPGVRAFLLTKALMVSTLA